MCLIAEHEDYVLMFSLATLMLYKYVLPSPVHNRNYTFMQYN